MIKKFFEYQITPGKGFDYPNGTSQTEFLIDTITKSLNIEQSHVRNADWGDCMVWSLDNDELEGLFVIIVPEDDDSVVLTERHENEKTGTPIFYDYYTAYNNSDLETLLYYANNRDKLKKIKKAKKYNLIE